MKKFLLMLVTVFMTAMSYAQVDTILFEPEKPGNYEVKVDTVKYPYLKDVDVNWFCGFGDLEVNFQSQGRHVVCAQKVPKEAFTTLNDTTKLLHMEAIPEVWNPWQDVRTVVLFYTHKIETKSVITDEYGSFYDRSEFEGFTCDTVAVLHILKDFTKVTNPTDIVGSFQVNGKNENVIDLVAGDTAKFTVIPVNDLDIQEYALVANDDIIAISDSGYFELVPDETIEDINLLVSNKTGEYEFNWPKTLKVYPKFDVTNITYTVSNNGKTTIVENSESKGIEVSVLNHDSVSLRVETNISETLNPTKVTYTWNKDGKTLPEGVKTNNGKLTIAEYVKPNMDGVYNCLVTANDTTIVTSFTVTSAFSTANENLSVTDVTIINTGDGIIVNNVSQKSVRVTTTIGKIIYNRVATSDNVTINLPTGIYFVTVDNKTYKIAVK